MSLVLDSVSLTLAGQAIVKNLSLYVRQGEVIGLLGPNGAGKTTTFNMLIGFIKPDFGIVSLEGTQIANLPMTMRARLGLGYLPQEASIFRKLSVKENLDIALSQSQMSISLCRERRDELINEFNLMPFLNRYGFQLSGGERRRCEIARALAVGKNGPRYLLLDEPFAGIDPIAVKEIQKLIFSLKSKGMGILITDHNVRETLAITDRSYILNQGVIIASGSSNDVATDPDVKKNYLGIDFEL